MKPSVEVIGNRTVISHNGDTLSFLREHWGHPDVIFNDNQIPSAKIWRLIAKYMMEEVQIDLEELLHEARIANIFRQLEIGLLIWTLNPEKKDAHVKGNVYIRKERQRIRHLTDKFQIKIAKIDGDFTPEVVKELHEVCLTLGLHPVGCVDERIYYARSPEKVFRAFGSNDFTRIAVYCKRPSSSSFPLALD